MRYESLGSANHYSNLTLFDEPTRACPTYQNIKQDIIAIIESIKNRDRE